MKYFKRDCGCIFLVDDEGVVSFTENICGHIKKEGEGQRSFDPLRYKKFYKEINLFKFLLEKTIKESLWSFIKDGVDVFLVRKKISIMEKVIKESNG